MIPKRNPSSTFKVHRFEHLRGFSSRSWKSCFGFLLFFLLETFSKEVCFFFLKDCYDYPILMSFTRVNPAPWHLMDFSFAPPRGNNSAVRSGLKPLHPGSRGWWLVVVGQWLVVGHLKGHLHQQHQQRAWLLAKKLHMKMEMNQMDPKRTFLKVLYTPVDFNTLHVNV